jgi:hypothetical protein
MFMVWIKTAGEVLVPFMLQAKPTRVLVFLFLFVRADGLYLFFIQYQDDKTLVKDEMKSGKVLFH